MVPLLVLGEECLPAGYGMLIRLIRSSCLQPRIEIILIEENLQVG
jgi:hypothetical protein